MLYYRYRPCNELTIKEILYNEIYFSTPEERNDPFDGKINVPLVLDAGAWGRVLRWVMCDSYLELKSLTETLISDASVILATDGPKTHEDAIKCNYSKMAS